MNINPKKRNKMRYHPLVLLALLVGHVAIAQNISLEDTWKDYTFVPEIYQDIQYLKDNHRFARISGNAIKIYESLTNDSVGTLVDFSKHKALASARIRNFEIDSSNTVVLLESKVKNKYRYSYTARYYLFDTRSNSLKAATHNQKPAEMASLSGCGTMVAYVQDNNLFIKQGEEHIAVSKDGIAGGIINGVSDWVHEEEFNGTKAYEWSPTSKHIAWIRFDEREVPSWSVTIYDSTYPSTHNFKYPKVGYPVARVSVKVFDINKRKAFEVPLPEESTYIGKMAWSPDGKRLAVVSINREQNRLSISSFDTQTKKTDVIYKESSKSFIQLPNEFTWMKDGVSFVLLKSHANHMRLCRHTVGDSTFKVLTPFDQDVVKLCAYDSHHGCLYYELADADGLNTKIYRVMTDGSSTGFITPEQGQCHDISFSPDFSNFIYTTSNATQRISTYAVDYLKSLKSEIYNNDNLLDTCKTRGCTSRELRTFKVDSAQLNYSLTFPREFDSSRRYPTLFCVYGGPGIPPVVTNAFDYNYYWQQYLVSQGIVVVSIDPRGTSWRGLSWRDATMGALGTLQLSDILATVNHLKKQEWFDSTKVGIQGWSFGGYMVLQALARSQAFCCGVSIAPVTDWTFYNAAYTERYMQTPATNPTGYESTSILPVAKNIKGTLLLAHGMNDDNVHAQNTYELCKTLNNNNIHYTLLLYPDKNHNLSGGNTKLHLYREMCKFIIEKLKE